MSKIKVLSIIFIAILVSTCFIFNYNTGDYENNTKDINLEILNNPNKSSQINLNSDSRGSLDIPKHRKSLECNIRGGCWLDSYIDDSGIEGITNCISEYRNIRLSSQSLEFIDTDYKVTCAYNGIECLELLKNNKIPDLILLDIMMPGMDGWETFKNLQENPVWKNIPVFFLTSRTDAVANNACDLLAADFIQKPYDIKDLKIRINKVLKNANNIVKE